MKIHSRIGLITNSSSETFSFSGLDRPDWQIQRAVDDLWIEWASEDENFERIREWWPYRSPCTKEEVIQLGSPIHFSGQHDGSYEYFTIMNNLEAPDVFAEFVVSRMNRIPVYQPGNMMRIICTECMRQGYNTCPPCRL